MKHFFNSSFHHPARRNARQSPSSNKDALWYSFDVSSLTIFYRPEPEALVQWRQLVGRLRKSAGGNLKMTNWSNRDLKKALNHPFVQCYLCSTFLNNSVSFKVLHILMIKYRNKKEYKQQKHQQHLEIFWVAMADFVQIHPFSEVSQVHCFSAKASLEYRWNTVSIWGKRIVFFPDSIYYI